MANYLISWEESVWMDLTIEANSQKEALDKFHANEYDVERVVEVGREWIPDTIDIEEI